MYKICKLIALSTLFITLSISMSIAAEDEIYYGLGNSTGTNITSEKEKLNRPGVIHMMCESFKTNLKYRDGAVNKKESDVRELQDFLISQNYLKSSSTGMFGDQTKKALEEFQLANGVTPSGNLGEMTRDIIKKMVCNNVNDMDFKLRSQASGTPTSTRPHMFNSSNTKATGTVHACTMEYRECANGQPMKRDFDCTWREDMCENSYDAEALKAKREAEKKLREQNLKKLDAQIKKDLKEKKVKYNHMKPQIFKSNDSASQSVNLVKSAFFDYLGN